MSPISVDSAPSPINRLMWTANNQASHGSGSITTVPLAPLIPTPQRLDVWPRRQRVGADLVDVVATRLARADRGLDRLDLVDVDDGLVSVAADAVHGGACPKRNAVADRVRWTARSGRVAYDKGTVCASNVPSAYSWLSTESMMPSLSSPTTIM